MSVLSRRQFLGRMGVLYGAVSAGPVLWTRPAASSGLPRAPRIGWGGDPRTTLTVSWSTDGPVRNPVVDLGVDDGFGRPLAADTRTVPGWPVHYHRVTVDGLEPGRGYRYRVRHDGGAGPARTVRAAPAAPEPFTFAAYGDQGTTTGAEQVMGILARAVPAFTFCLGDLCYADMSGGVAPAGRVDHQAWDRWLGMVSQATAATAAVLPAVGNHE
ncbi:MAG TPA: fibronectin type III domain-containing protein, partial [Acidimicrobiia bacterium]|nr:fibronectin type III domain-containing protein [Acidimicrobiia bacterium]